MVDILKASQLRKSILDMAYAGSTVHIGCAFSIVEILAVLYRDFLNFPNQDCEHPDRDYMVLSKGHGVMAQYACMQKMGWLTQDNLNSYFMDGTELKGLSDSRVKGLEVTSGSLGHGFSIGVGMALGAKLNKTNQKTYILVGDGEINEGSIWEGAMFSAHNQLKNMMVIVDENGFQAMGKTDEIISLGVIENKFKSFGFETATTDGHDEVALKHAINSLWNSKSFQPKALIAKTIKGKGVSFMENNNLWHYTRLTAEIYEKALAEVGGV
jgi:transketolase